MEALNYICFPCTQFRGFILLLVMVRGVVYDDDGLVRQIWQQLFFKPLAKVSAVHLTMIVTAAAACFENQPRAWNKTSGRSSMKDDEAIAGIHIGLHAHCCCVLPTLTKREVTVHPCLVHVHNVLFTARFP